jgi:sugar fermentation stimulation protein A
MLLIEVSQDLDIKIGKLGRISFGKGKYVYIGSAKVGFAKRIKRHLRKEKRFHWHIDYLLAQGGKVYEVRVSKDLSECHLAKILREEIGAYGIQGFGSSDCKCFSHLYRINGHQARLKEVFKREGLVRYHVS